MIQKIISTFFILFINIIVFAALVQASEGDNSLFYEKCVRSCLSTNCTKDGALFTTKLAHLQDTWSRLLLWSCRDECRYHCMWQTVSVYQKRGYAIPKFHGKWPFKRYLGVTEPASAFCSLLNLAANVYMVLKIVKNKSFTVKETPLLLFWYLLVAVCVHAWAWSTIFHTRDTPFTEFMDYACALSMVITLFVASIVRVFYRKKYFVFAVALLTLVYYIEHTRYLYGGSIDYQYNLAVNVCFGVAGSTIWLSWALAQLCYGRRHTWRLVYFTNLSGAALMLELFDFPPKYGWDAHALWHLCTAPLPLLFYRFVMDDLSYLQTKEIVEKKSGYKLA